MALTETLVSTFDSIPAAFSSQPGTPAPAVSGGYLVLGTNASYPRIQTGAVYSLAASYMSMQVVRMPDTSVTTAELVLQLYDGAGTSGYEARLTAGGLRWRKYINSVATDVAVGTFNPINHAWWKIANPSGNVIEFSTSSNGITWTVQSSATATTPQITSLFPSIIAGNYTTTTADALVDNLNTVGAAPGQIRVVSQAIIRASYI